MRQNIKLMFYLAYFNMRARYRKTVAGFFWVIANPILTFVVQAFIFKNILKLNINNYPLFLLTGLMPWFFISQSFNSITNCLVNSRELLLGIKIHPLLMVGVQVIDQFFNFLVAFFVLMTLISLFGNVPLTLGGVLLVIPSVLILFLFVFASIAMLSFWHVFYRDIQFIIQFIMNLAFFVTPIFYSVETIASKHRWVLMFNPFVPFIRLFQNSIYELQLNEWLNNFLLGSLIVGIVTFFVWLSYYKKMKEIYIHV